MTTEQSIIKQLRGLLYLEENSMKSSYYASGELGQQTAKLIIKRRRIIRRLENAA